ncbi:hypothetical protein NC99_42610 [Sunxiuqinia dokdonensis]|uniref:Uncharacterized protein n=1 Tax=Sunxiuqinia dokdonensis TaxID=1409788 RepID=A0A0L8V3B4_9BACT|nr:hypothetical protein NC99_42610 [Sunxiuqinia dokdonensis]
MSSIGPLKNKLFADENKCLREKGWRTGFIGSPFFLPNFF